MAIVSTKKLYLHVETIPNATNYWNNTICESVINFGKILEKELFVYWNSLTLRWKLTSHLKFYYFPVHPLGRWFDPTFNIIRFIKA